MDLFVLGAVALLCSIFSALIALITRKPKLRMLTYAVVGLIIGIPIGYVLAPFILSFY